MGSIWGLVLRNASRALAAHRRRGAEGEEGAESGFTLIELMVVLLIMGILLAIAIPTFLGLTGGANDRSAQSNLSNALTNAKAIYAQSQTFDFGTTAANYSSVFAAKMHNATTSLGFTSLASTGQTKISVDVATATQVYFAAWMPKTGVCWMARAVETPTGNTPSDSPYGYGFTTATFKTTATEQAKCVASSYKTLVTTATTKKGDWSRSFPPSPTGH